MLFEASASRGYDIMRAAIFPNSWKFQKKLQTSPERKWETVSDFTILQTWSFKRTTALMNFNKTINQIYSSARKMKLYVVSSTWRECTLHMWVKQDIFKELCKFLIGNLFHVNTTHRQSVNL